MGGGDDVRAAFRGKTVTLASPLGALELGVVDPHHPGVDAAISRLLFRSIEDARATTGGHLPDWLVEDIKRNYIAPERIRSLWAPTGHRFAVALRGEIVATVHVTREHDTIFTIDRHTINVSSREHPGFKPDGYHHVVNLSVLHELRRARLATAMFDGILTHFRDMFDGVGLWVRADPPWHAGLAGLGFVHDPARDIFLPATAERTAGLPHDAFNLRHACDCAGASNPSRARAMKEEKLQYVSFTRDFGGRVTRGHAPAIAEIERDEATRERFATDWGQIARKVPKGVARPASTTELSSVLARASEEGTRVAVRGKGHSAAGQSLARTEEGLVVSTERLDRIVAIEDDRVTVQAGVTLQTLALALAPRGVFPPVLTGWLPATVGGVLAAGGYSKGSHAHGLVVDHVLGLVVVTGDGRAIACSARQAAWLFDAALGGMGSFGVIAEATLRLAPLPRFVTVEKTRTNDLAAALDDADPATYHVTAFGDASGFTVVRARGIADGGIPIASYVAPERPSEAPGPLLFLHAFLPRAELDAYVGQAALDHDRGDAIQVIPVKNLRGARASLLQLPDADVAYAVSITREVRDRDRATLEAWSRARLAQVTSLGGKAYLAGTPPRGEAEWRAHIGASWEAVVRAKRLADPRIILEGPFTAP